MTNQRNEKYAVIDLEATNAGPEACIIQVGIVILEGNTITSSYQTDINPHEPLSDHIKQLTGITDHQLSQAPDFSQVAKEIYDLICDCVFVAHNVKFDANLLAESLFFEGYELRTPRIDTVELAQIFFPRLEKYNLSHLSEALNLNLFDAHTAIADAMATAQLFLKLKNKIASLPLETLEILTQFSDNLLFESGIVIDQALEIASAYNPKIHVKVEDLLLKKEVALGKPLKLSKDFQVNLALLALEERPLQEQFAHLVQEALLSPEPSFIQAQAGIGKSYGYLLPLLAHHQGQQILVSVPTKILQDQMAAKELASLKEAYHINCHSIKGPANYLKLDFFLESLRRFGDNRVVNRYKMQLVIWLLETDTGDLDEIKQKQRFAAYFDQIKHDGDLKQSSPFYAYDFWQRSYEKAKKADVLLTNHAYFLHRVEDDKNFAKGKILVFDEAQSLVLQLDQLSRKQMDIAKVLQEIEKNQGMAKSLLEKRLLESLSFELSNVVERFYHHPEMPCDTEMIEQLKTLVSELNPNQYDVLHDFFNYEQADYWLSTEKNLDKRVATFNASSSRFTNFKSFLPETIKTYFVSATLQISPQVSLAQLLGFDNYSYAAIPKLKSDKQLVLIDQSMPLIKEMTDETYCYEIARRVAQLQNLHYPVLVLFNSKKHMMQVSEVLESWKVMHLTQEKNGSSYNIKKRFDRGEQSILLGMGAFWEGVDFIHADRMIEVITRLPFDSPNNSFVVKMTHYLHELKKEPFKDYFLPMAILKLKQAIGRTMRRDNQKSVIMILDRRISSQSYGGEILKALEQEFQTSEQKFDDSLFEMAQFLI